MSLASKFFWNTLVLLTLVLGLTGWLSIEDEREAIEELQVKHGTSMAHSLAAFSAESVISKDYPALDKALQTIGQSADNIVQINITQKGNMLARFGSGSENDGQVFAADILFSDDGISQRPIGKVQVILSKKDSEAIISNRINELLVNSVILFFSLAGALSFLTNNLVLRRVRQLTQLTEGVIERLPEHTTPSAAKQSDELDRLNERYSAMLAGLEWREKARSDAMQSLKAAEALLDDVANSLTSALIVISHEDMVEYCNTASLLFTDTPCLRGEKRPLAECFPQLREKLENFAETTAPRQVLELHRQIWKTADRQRIVNLAIYPLSAGSGTVIRIDDVTERTRFDELMIQSEKMASVGGLAAGIAHEINNPLGVMVQAAQNIERRVSDSIAANHQAAAACGTDLPTIRNYLEKRSILEFLGDIKSDGARAAKIVRSLLEFSRKSESRLQPACLLTLLERAAEMARKDFDLKKNFDFRRIDVIYDIATDLPDIPMIASEVEQVILNLLKNSAQAMGDKFGEKNTDSSTSPRIALQAKKIDGMVEIVISDNGPGFSEDAKKRAFEPFFTTKAPGIGTGLGLWVSYMIITDKHKGRMTLESTPGEGATFTLCLPL